MCCVYHDADVGTRKQTQEERLCWQSWKTVCLFNCLEILTAYNRSFLCDIIVLFHYEAAYSGICEHSFFVFRVPTPPGKYWEVLDFFLKVPGSEKSLENLGKSLWSWKVLEINGWGPGKSWKNILENYPFFVGSHEKQAAVVYHPVCIDYCLFKYCVRQFKKFFCSLRSLCSLE